jgi:hypothetical protein
MNELKNQNLVGRQMLGDVGGAIGQRAAARQSAKGVLRDRVDRLRREADRLEALCKALPEEMPPMADEALWDLAIGKH